MGQEFFEIWDKDSKEYIENGPTLETFLIDSEKALGAVLVLPGGGYRALAEHESGCIAKEFNNQGFHAFVLKYRIAPHRFPSPQLDVWQAIRIIRKNAAKWNVNPNMISVLGFSAGGHLAASSAVLYKELNDVDNVSIIESNVQI
jgi:acetyl esterase/lipase